MAGRHVVAAGDVTAILDALEAHRVEVCLSGGWAVDALLGEQTREHSDLDLWAPAAHLEWLFRALAGRGVDRIFPRPGDRPWNFVLHDGARLRVDLHLYERFPDGRLHFGSPVGGVTFPAAALNGQGVIDGQPVRCEVPEWAVRWHTGYPPRAADRHDVPLLCARFGIALPDSF
ncbi:aminoglycoside nucleotidyltransferase [Actinoplanes hulinensis]|uniref:Aminoglycoside nucleotidyltransferase n=1 Tax=Actinoplanes hulinensis TaxID=1144547 RepID=A0ABS7B5J5_9ACTN|nr:aminoglycoside nucleotidyltransferase [Actinoplanes hulinensis]MBW6436152.1 aminoglycoside nucleotidyltransferase [Actinoplanes hulinensis]